MHRLLPCLLLLLAILAPLPLLAAQPLVLFDQGHDQRFLVEREEPLDLSGLAAAFRSEGYRTASTGEVLSSATLADASVLVISGAFTPLTPAEQEAVTNFVSNGGRLCVLLHVAPPLAALLDRFGIVTSNASLRENDNLIDGEALNFRVVDLTAPELFGDLTAFKVYGAWALLPEGATAHSIANTGPRAWIDLNGDRRLDKEDAQQAFSVAAIATHGQGRVIVFGDDALFQNRYLEGSNARLAARLARWLR